MDDLLAPKRRCFSVTRKASSVLGLTHLDGCQVPVQCSAVQHQSPSMLLLLICQSGSRPCHLLPYPQRPIAVSSRQSRSVSVCVVHIIVSWCCFPIHSTEQSHPTHFLPIPPCSPLLLLSLPTCTCTCTICILSGPFVNKSILRSFPNFRALNLPRGCLVETRRKKLNSHPREIAVAHPSSIYSSISSSPSSSFLSHQLASQLPPYSPHLKFPTQPAASYSPLSSPILILDSHLTA